MLSPRAKTHNYLNMIVAEQSVKAHDPEGWAVLLDVNGNLAEGMGSNIFVVREGKLYTPSERYVLAGISRQMTLDLARKLDIPAIEGDIDLFDAANAEEMFLTSTSLCIAGVRSFNGARGRRRPRARSDHEAPDGRLHRRGGLRFRQAVSGSTELTLSEF